MNSALRVVVLVLLAVCVQLAGCAGVQSPGDVRIHTVRSALAELMEADNAGDLDAIAASYTEDAVLLPPSGEVVRGREAIRARYAAGFERFALEVDIVLAKLEIEGVQAFCWGKTHGRLIWNDGTEPTPFVDNYFMTLALKPDGRWRVAHLAWHADPDFVCPE
jgi:uncharacterized protein (TIGR02246 family)